MNASLWQFAGWTMIHSLWLGAAVALAGGFVRLACRRAAPAVRYAISLATFAALAATPIAVAAWLNVNGVPQLAVVNFQSILPPSVSNGSLLPPPPGGEGWGGGQKLVHAPHPPSLTLPIEEREPEEKLAGLAGQVIDLAHTSPSPRYSGERLGEGPNPLATTPHAHATVENPSPNPSLPGRGISTNLQSPLTNPPAYSPTHLLTYSLASALPHLPTLWLLGAPLTFTLLATGLIGSERLRRRATLLTAGSAYEACERLRHTLKITRRVALAVSDGVVQPILVGIVRPLILLPTAALAGWTPEQLDMVLLHELAHVRRWDNLANLLQRIVESLLFYHPAVWLVSRQVRRDREECCDAAVIRHTNRPEAYATLLIDIASRLRLSGQLNGPQSLTVASAMASHPLAGRIRRILNIEEEPMRITRRTLAATLLLPLLLAAAIFYSGASAQDPPPSKGGARGGIQDAGDQSTAKNDDKEKEEDGAAEQATTESSAKPQPATIKAAEKVILTVYPVGNLPPNIDLRQWMELVASDPRIEVQWMPKEKGLLIAAPERIHNELKSLLNDARKKATTIAAQKDEAEIPFLQNQIRSLETLIAKTQEDLTNIEVFKELTVKKGTSNTALDEALRKQLAADQKLKNLDDRLFNSDRLLEAAKADASTTPERIAELEVLDKELQAERKKYRHDAEKAIRERLAKLPNDQLRAALAEYKIRRQAAEENLAKYKQELEAAKTKMLQLGVASGAPAPQPAPLLDRLEQLRLAFDQQRPLFFKQPDEQLQKVRYDGAKLPDVVDDHWHYLVKGIANEPGKPPISFNWFRRGNDNYEIEVPAAAHEKFFRPLFDGTLPTVSPGAPGSPNQGAAATGSHANDAPPTANAPRGSAAPVQQTQSPVPQPSVPPSPYRPSPFPTLENQKIADRAYKLLGLELDPLAPEELERVKKLGYAGGLRVSRGNEMKGVLHNDLLVGLHVWPVTDLNSLDEVLQRDDLGELNPLKYYVIRDGHGRDARGRQGGDGIVAGRLSIPEAELFSRELNRNNQAEMQPAASAPTAGDLNPYASQAAASAQTTKPPLPASPPLAIGDAVFVRVAGALSDQPIDAVYNVDDLGTLAFGPTYGRVPVVGLTILEAEKAIQEKLQTIVQNPQVQVSRLSKPEAASPSSGAPTFLYDGKTFDQWRDLWKLELNPKRRVEAIKALTAFSRAGHGREAADAVLEVASQYDFSKSYSSDEETLKQTVIALCAQNYGNQIAATDWLPALEQLLKKDPKQNKTLALWLLEELHETDDEVKAALKALEANDDPEIRAAAEAARTWPEKLLEELMKADADGDQQLNEQEAVATKRFIPGEFKSLDENQDDQLSREELQHAIPNRLGRRPPQGGGGQGGGFF